MAARIYLYDAEGNDREVELSKDVLKSLGDQRLLWIDVDDRDPSTLNELAEQLGIEAEAIGALERRGTARVDNFGAYTHFSVDTVPSRTKESTKRADRGPRLDFLVSAKWLLTVHEGKVGFIDDFRTEDRPETMIGALTTHDFAASLLDAHLEAFFEEVARIEDMVDKLDEQALTKPSSGTLLSRMVSLRRRVSRLRNLLSRQRGVFYGLSRPDLQVVNESGAAPHFQILASRFERAIDEVEHTRDLVVGSFELFASRTAQQTNELVKALTFITVILGASAAIAGVFGMNFETGFFKTGDEGFYVTVGALLLLAVVASIFARRRGWL
jgi:magnesium transporter